jgi:hypothetical protein
MSCVRLGYVMLGLVGLGMLTIIHNSALGIVTVFVGRLASVS